MNKKDESFKDFILDQLQELDGVEARRMFGGFGVYQDETFFGILPSASKPQANPRSISRKDAKAAKERRLSFRSKREILLRFLAFNRMTGHGPSLCVLGALAGGYPIPRFDGEMIEVRAVESNVALTLALSRKSGRGDDQDSRRRSTGMNNVTDGCQCGAVRYECAVAPVFTGNCHCRDCQRATGGAYVPAFAVPAQALKITGEVKYYESPSDSGNTFKRGFCPTCGGRVFGKTSGFPQFMLITAGSLADPSRFKPSMDFFTSSASPGIT